MKPALQIRDWPVVLWVTAATSIVLLALCAFQWNVADIFTPFILIPLFGAAWLLFLTSVVWALVYLVVKRKQWRQAGIPAALCLVTLCAVTFVPFTRIWIYCNFASERRAREAVVREVLAGTLKPNVSYDSTLIALPPGSPEVSMGGNQIIVEKHRGKDYVFFYGYCGVLDNYFGFLWVPTGGDPTLFSDLNETEDTQLIKFGGHWFFAAHR